MFYHTSFILYNKFSVLSTSILNLVGVLGFSILIHGAAESLCSNRNQRPIRVSACGNLAVNLTATSLALPKRRMGRGISDMDRLHSIQLTFSEQSRRAHVDGRSAYRNRRQ